MVTVLLELRAGKVGGVAIYVKFKMCNPVLLSPTNAKQFE